MSKQLNNQIKKDDSVQISEIQLQFLTGVDTVQRSVNYYHDQIKTEYLRQIALEHGYSLEDNLEFAIDLKSEERQLTIKKIEQPAQPDA
jgi:hypothetical protein